MEAGWIGKRVADLRVRARAPACRPTVVETGSMVSYPVSDSKVSTLVVEPDGSDVTLICSVADALPGIDAVVDGFRRTIDVGQGSVRAVSVRSLGVRQYND